MKILRNKKRHVCAKCKAKKYIKYMGRKLDPEGFIVKGWFCKNREKCLKRSANYQK
jgi:hypothetical protein